MRLLIIRTSAMGDVALTTPVLIGMRKQYPDIEMVLLTRQSFKPFFSSINGLSLFFPDLTKSHRGVFVLLRLYKDINKQANVDHVFNLNDVIRSKIVVMLLNMSGIHVAVID